MTDFEFLAWEARSKDTIDFKTVYVDIAGDVVAGLYLSQCIYWHLPNKAGDTKLRREYQGKLWLAKADNEWWQEIRLTPKQARRARESLTEKGIVESRVLKFKGTPKCHIRLNMQALMREITLILQADSDLPCRANGLATEGESTCPVGHPSFTENTTENTTETVCDNPLDIKPKGIPEQLLKPLADYDKIKPYGGIGRIMLNISGAVAMVGADVVRDALKQVIERASEPGFDPKYIPSIVTLLKDQHKLIDRASQYKSTIRKPEYEKREMSPLAANHLESLLAEMSA